MQRPETGIKCINIYIPFIHAFVWDTEIVSWTRFIGFEAIFEYKFDIAMIVFVIFANSNAELQTRATSSTRHYDFFSPSNTRALADSRLVKRSINGVTRITKICHYFVPSSINKL